MPTFSWSGPVQHIIDRAAAGVTVLGPGLTSSMLFAAAWRESRTIGDASIRSIYELLKSRERQIDEAFAAELSAIDRTASARTLQSVTDRRVSLNVFQIFIRAEKIRLARGESTISPYCLLAAFLEMPERTVGASKRLISAGVDLDAFRGEFDRLTGGAPSDAAHSAQMPSGPVPARLSGFNADVDGGPDCLSIDADVNALANLFASKALRPPLAIGLFGDWGSGKSFFMRRLQAAVKTLVDDASTADSPDYWGRVRQISFNAWHYADSNLWASLISHLLAELAAAGTDRIADETDAQRRRVVTGFAIASEAATAAANKLGQAFSAHTSAEAALREREVRFDLDKAHLAAAVGHDVWSRLLQRLAGDSALSERVDAVRNNLSDLGVEMADVQTSARHAYDQLAAVNTTAGRLRAIGVSVASGYGFIPSLLLAAGIGVAALAAAWVVAAQFHGIGPVLPAVAGGAGALVGLITGAVKWVSTNAGRVGSILRPLEQARAALDSALHTAEQARAEELSRLGAEVDRRKAEVVEATRQVDRTRQEVRAAQDKLEDLRSGKFIAQFIEQRVASGDYQKHLGLVATVRGDLDRLDRMVADHNRHRVDKTDPAGVPDLGINRVVLYIDDLDRCPPEKVVEVLQAIHLLLAFELFVVVVGVDARWVTHALKTRYGELLAGTADSARPEDYLEKIFQIPIWLRPIQPDGTRNLLRSMLSYETAAAPPGAGGKANEIALDPIEHGTPDTGRDFKVREPEPLPTRPRPQSLVFSDGEIDAISELASILGRSPRAVKRFVNSYRIIKASDAGPLPEGSDPLDRFRPAMLLLALMTGAPVDAARFFALLPGIPTAHLESVDTENLPGAVYRLARSSPEWGQLSTSDLAAWLPRVMQFSFIHPAVSARSET